MDDVRTDFYVYPGGRLKGTLEIPGDKSISHRAVMLGAVAVGITNISGFLSGTDCLGTINAFRDLGVMIVGPQAEDVKIVGEGLDGLRAPHRKLNLGNSGTAMRLLTGMLAAQPFDSYLTGDESLVKRPMARIADPLTSMGAKIQLSPMGTPPIQIKAVRELRGITYTLPVASAQVKSCLLLAGLFAQGTTRIIEPQPTRDHTERMLMSFGANLQREPGAVSITGGRHLFATDIQVPADISSAAFFMVAAAILPDSEIFMPNIGINPCRTGVLTILKLMGARLEVTNERMAGNEPIADIRIATSDLQGIEIPPELIPTTIDEFPILFIAAACARGVTTLRGAEELRHKESDRIQVMAEGLSILGIKTEVFPDGIRIEGGAFDGGTVDCHGDHRAAMSFAVAGLIAKSRVIVLDCINVATSFPHFVTLAQSNGLRLNVMQKR